jgi:hypothetical protein
MRRTQSDFAFGFTIAFAGAASAVVAIKRDINTGSIGGIRNQLVGPRLDEARRSVLKIERNTVYRLLAPPGSPRQMW